MALYLCSGGSGSIDKYKTSKTLIADNTSKNTSFTFNSDYHDFNMVLFEITNNSDNSKTYILTIPDIIDGCFSVANRINFNQTASIQYCTYSENNLTWNRTNNRSCNITHVWGINFVNFSVESTKIYQANSLSTSSLSINYNDGDLLSFDFIFYAANSNDPTEIQPCNDYFCDIFNIEDLTCVFNSYDNANEITIYNHVISSARFFSVYGIKLI